jgi:hypothetical protein
MLHYFCSNDKLDSPLLADPGDVLPALSDLIIQQAASV